MTAQNLISVAQESSHVHQRQVVRCPNCGQHAIRTVKNDRELAGNCPGDRFTHLECPSCDYLAIACSLTGKIVEAYAPYLDMSRWRMRPQPESARTVA